MAMSKRCFVVVVLLVLAVLLGTIGFVIWQNNSELDDNSNGNSKAEVDISLSSSHSSITPEKAAMMCEAVVNGTEPEMGTYNHPGMFQSTLAVNSLHLRVVQDYNTGDTYQKNSYWITGDEFADREAISMIRVEACKGKIPLIVIKMRPKEGLTLSRNIQVWNHYQPQQNLRTWSDYDKRLNTYLKYLAPIPALVVLEPDLLMFGYDKNNLQYDWINAKYKEEFYIRAQRIVKVMSKSWVYVDAGNAAYLGVRENMEKMAKSLLRLEGLRGFSINTAHFFNTSYNNMMARRLHCLTGLHYITDTSRNGGLFSRQSTDGIVKCFFDPPKIQPGLTPGWSWGIKRFPRQRRWVAEIPSPASTLAQHSPQTHQPTSQQYQYPLTIGARPWSSPPNSQEDPEGYNNYINSMRNNNANGQNSGNNVNYNTVNNAGNTFHFGTQGHRNPQQQPTNQQPNNFNSNQRQNNPGSGPMNNNDLRLPSGRVPINAITVAPKRTTSRSVSLRTKEEALAIYRRMTIKRNKCLKIEPVQVHDANVWIKTPGEADGRLYPYGMYQKCLLGHTQGCEEECRLIMNSKYEERQESCGCKPRGSQSSSPTQNHGIFFPGSDSELANPYPGLGDPNDPSYSQDPLSSHNVPPSYSSLSEILEAAGKR